MWLSKAMASRQQADQEGSAADMGVTTIGGGSASVMTRGEQRNLEVFAPGGMVWQPRAGDTVLVLKGGPGSQEQCVVAANTTGAAPDGFTPGELFLFSSGSASVYLRGDGSIVLKGNVEIQGPVNIMGGLTVNGRTYEPCRCN